VLALIPALIGLGIAGRHVWLQYLPPEQVPACGPDLAYMMEAFPLGTMLRQVLTGSGECAAVTWRLLGLSMPEWSLLWFALLTVWLLAAAFAAASLICCATFAPDAPASFPVRRVAPRMSWP